ncbi:MAG TPA: hypothetical protein VE650_00175 [Acetobacteraceae bacterium]|nr:hypothetical protein [Acetobacteraceae bacterium]
MIEAGRFTVPAGHPCLEGHFPGRPVVPGVVLLDLALEAILGASPRQRVAGLPVVKFTRPVLPEQEVAVLCGPQGAGPLAFACHVDGQEVARGTVQLGAG